MIEALKISLIAYMFCAMGQNGLIFSLYQKLISKLPDWLSWPLGKCFKCFTGQVCLWYFVITKPFNIIDLTFFVSAGIISSMVWDKLYRWLDDIN
jgi:hypothetical protein